MFNGRYDGTDENKCYALEEMIFRNFKSNGFFKVEEEDGTDEPSIRLTAPKLIYVSVIRQALVEVGVY